MTDPESFIRKRIREARERAGFSQYDLAERFGSTQSSISGIERGRVSISAADLYRVAQILGKPITYFFPQKEPARKQLEDQLLFMLRDLPADVQQGVFASVAAQFQLARTAREIARLPEDQQEEAAYEALAQHLHALGVRIKLDDADYPILDGPEVTGILETVDEDDMPRLIEAVKRLQQHQG